MDNFELSELLDGRPEYTEDAKEKSCYDILDSLDIKYQRVEYNFFPKSSEDLEAIDKTIQVAGIKNLIFRTKNREHFFFIIIPREDKFDEKAFRNKYELPKITMAKNEDLETLLKTHPGVVSIMELVNDSDDKIKLFIDERVLNADYFRFHPNENKATVRISMDDFKTKLIPYLKHNINIL